MHSTYKINSTERLGLISEKNLNIYQQRPMLNIWNASPFNRLTTLLLPIQVLIDHFPGSKVK